MNSFGNSIFSLSSIFGTCKKKIGVSFLSSMSDLIPCKCVEPAQNRSSQKILCQHSINFLEVEKEGIHKGNFIQPLLKLGIQPFHLQRGISLYDLAMFSIQMLGQVKKQVGFVVKVFLNWLRQSTPPLGYGVCVIINMRYKLETQRKIFTGRDNILTRSFSRLNDGKKKI